MLDSLILLSILLLKFHESVSYSWREYSDQSPEFKGRIRTLRDSPRDLILSSDGPNHDTTISPNGTESLSLSDSYPKKLLRNLLWASPTRFPFRAFPPQSHQMKEKLLRHLYPTKPTKQAPEENILIYRSSPRLLPTTPLPSNDRFIMPDNVEYRVDPRTLLKLLKCNSICKNLISNTCNIKGLFSHCHNQGEYETNTTIAVQKINNTTIQSQQLGSLCEVFKYLSYSLLVITFSLSISLVYLFLRVRIVERQTPKDLNENNCRANPPSADASSIPEHTNVTWSISLPRQRSIPLYDVPTCPAKPVSTNPYNRPSTASTALSGTYEQMYGSSSKQFGKAVNVERPKIDISSKLICTNSLNLTGSINCKHSDGYELMAPLLSSTQALSDIETPIDEVYEPIFKMKTVETSAKYHDMYIEMTNKEQGPQNAPYINDIAHQFTEIKQKDKDQLYETIETPVLASTASDKGYKNDQRSLLPVTSTLKTIAQNSSDHNEGESSNIYEDITPMDLIP